MSDLSVLLVEDQPDDAVSIQRLLRNENIADWEVAQNAKDAINRVKEHGPFDVHIFDLHLPDASDLQLLERLTDAGFSAWDRSIVVTGVADSHQQGEAISAYGMPVVDKEMLSNSLSPWVKGIIKRPPEHLMSPVLAALGASAWGNGLCGFVRVPNATVTQIRQILPDAVSVEMSRNCSLVIMPQQGLRDVNSTTQRLIERLPGAPTAQSLVVIDVTRQIDLKTLSQRAVAALAQPDFEDAIWPLE